MKFLIDECLHASLVAVAHSMGHIAAHVNHRGLGGLEDWQLTRVIREEEYVFVTNNRADFLELYKKESLRHLTNTVVEVRVVNAGTLTSEYELPSTE